MASQQFAIPAPETTALSLADEPFPHVRHRISGRPTIQDITLALEYALQHADIPILWDLRDLDCDADMWICAAGLASTIINTAPLPTSSEKRAFVVADDTAQAGMEMVLGRLTVPWESATFRAMDEAFDWLAK